MLRFALCDDDPADLTHHRELVERYLAQRPHLEGRLTAFGSPDELLCRAGAESFHIYLLDVLMPGGNGVALGKRLREMDKEGVIIFCTSSPDFAVESYEARAFHYLLKPVTEEALFPVLDEAAAQLAARREETVLLRSREAVRKVSADQLVYVELADKRLCYHLTGGETAQSATIRGSFRDAAAELLTHRAFAMCGVSFVVNLEHIAALEHDQLRLKDGGRVPLSRAYREELTSRWLDYHLEGGR